MALAPSSPHQRVNHICIYNFNTIFQMLYWYSSGGGYSELNSRSYSSWDPDWTLDSFTGITNITLIIQITNLLNKIYSFNSYINVWLNRQYILTSKTLMIETTKQSLNSLSTPTASFMRCFISRKRKVWQGQAFETQEGSVNSLAVSPTPCLKIRHMFDSDV